MLGPDGLSQFEELSRREAARTAILFAFDLIEHDGEDFRNLPFLERKAALARLLRRTKAGILLNERIARAGRPCSPMRASLDRGHRVQEVGRYLSLRPVPRMDQGPQSRQRRRAAGVKREVESTIPRAPMTTRRKGEVIRGDLA